MECVSVPLWNNKCNIMAVVNYSANWCRKKETFRVPNELCTASVLDNATATAALNVACGSQLRAHTKNAVFYVAYMGIYT